MQTMMPLACFLSVIRPPGVQYENALLQIAPIDKAKCPFIKDRNDIGFQLYTRHNPTEYQELMIGDDERLFASNMDFHAPTVLYFHAFMEQPEDGSGIMVREAYMQRGNTNVIMIDAHHLEAGPWYFTAAQNTWYIGRFAAQFIDYMVSRGLNLNNTHLVGHSLGAQAAGVAGSALKTGRVARITGLDPALPLFSGLPLEQRLDVSDAQFVDIIHTDAGIFGYNEPIGHVDFYPNGGKSPQPGCELEIVIPQQLLLNKSIGDLTASSRNRSSDPRASSPSPVHHGGSSHEDIVREQESLTWVKEWTTSNGTEKAQGYFTYYLRDDSRTIQIGGSEDRDMKSNNKFDNNNYNFSKNEFKHIPTLTNKAIIKKNVIKRDIHKEIVKNETKIQESEENNKTSTIIKKQDIRNMETNMQEQINITKTDIEQEIAIITTQDNNNNETKANNNQYKDILNINKDELTRNTYNNNEENGRDQIHDINVYNNTNYRSNKTDKSNTTENNKINNNRRILDNNVLLNINRRILNSKFLRNTDTKIKNRQKRFLNLFKSENTDEHFIFKAIDIFKKRKNVLPVISVMREINTLVKSANGELNHITRERNNYVGFSPTQLSPIAYSLELGGGNKVVSFVKRLFGLAGGDRLTIGSGK